MNPQNPERLSDEFFWRSGVKVRSKEGHVHMYWREDLGRCHNVAAGCWCCQCKGYMCSCLCHEKESLEVPAADKELIRKLSGQPNVRVER